ncbi:MAG: PDZ domain-containing protein [Nitrospinota bacterium]|nr:MAG: PDZ domain-containing protein [Nitrospinota bacterium]
MSKKLCWLVGLLFFLVGCGGGDGSSDLPPQDAQTALRDEVFFLLKTHFLYPDRLPSTPDLFSTAQEVVDAVQDPFTRLVTAEGLSQLRQNLQGTFSGIGITINLNRDTGEITVVQVFEDTPAARAGLQPGDVVLAVDDVSTAGLALEEVAARIRGEAGTPVTLLLRRDAETFPVTIVREEIDIPSVTAQMLEITASSSGETALIGYIQQTTFTATTLDQLSAALQAVEESGGQGIILDLRDNPGGRLDVAVEEADRFIPAHLSPETLPLLDSLGCAQGLEQAGVITRILDREETQNICVADDFNGLTQTPYPPAELAVSLPLVILMNQNTASAAELLIAALKENSPPPTTTIGTRTFGKGLIQTIFTLSDGSGLIVTTQEFRTPTGEVINEQGIFPDITSETEDPLEVALQFFSTMLGL